MLSSTSTARPYSFHYRKTIFLAYPIMLSQLSHTLVWIADSIMVGKIGTTSLAAASVAGGIFSIALVAGIGIGIGITPLVAAADGRKNAKEIATLAKHGFWLNVGLGLIFSALLWVASYFFHFLKQPQDVTELAIPYFRSLAISIFPIMIFSFFKQFAEGLSDTKSAMIITLVANVLNVFFNYLLIYGNWGFPELGVLGAGVATLLSRIILAIIMAWYVLKNAKFQAYMTNWLKGKLQKKEVLRQLNMGVPISMQMVFEAGVFAVAAVMVGWIGAKELAAHQIALTGAASTFMIATGIAGATAVRVGNYYGKREPTEIRRAAFAAFHLTLFFMTITAILFITLGKNIAAFYIDDAEVIELTAVVYMIVGCFQLFDGSQVVWMNALRGVEDVKIPTIIAMLSYWVVGLGISYLLGVHFNWGLSGIWTGLAFGLATASITLWIRFYYHYKRLQKKLNF